MARGLVPTATAAALAGCLVLSACSSSGGVASPQAPVSRSVGPSDPYGASASPTVATPSATRTTAPVTPAPSTAPAGPRAPSVSEARAILKEYNDRKNVGANAPNKQNYALADGGFLLEYDDWRAQLEVALAAKRGKLQPLGPVTYTLDDVLGWSKEGGLEMLVLSVSKREPAGGSSVVMVLARGDGQPWINVAEAGQADDIRPASPLGTISPANPGVVGAVQTYFMNGQVPPGVSLSDYFTPYQPPFDNSNPSLSSQFNVSVTCVAFNPGHAWQMPVSGNQVLTIVIPRCATDLSARTSDVYITPAIDDEAESQGLTKSSKLRAIHEVEVRATAVVTAGDKHVWSGGFPAKIVKSQYVPR